MEVLNTIGIIALCAVVIAFAVTLVSMLLFLAVWFWYGAKMLKAMYDEAWKD